MFEMTAVMIRYSRQTTTDEAYLFWWLRWWRCWRRLAWTSRRRLAGAGCWIRLVII